MSESVGFIGLGNMGAPMAANLLKAGFEVRVFNRTPGKAAQLEAMGARRVSLPSEVVRPGGVLVTMVSDDLALESLASADFGVVEALGYGGVHLSMSTISPATSRMLSARHGERGVAYVAAPVFGRPDAATTARLWVCVSGPAEAKARVRPLLDAMGQGVFDFGEDAGAANVAKLCGNLLIGAAIESLAESLALAEKSGVDRGAVADMLGRTLFACPIYQGYGRAMVEGRFQPAGFRLSLGLKDVNLALAAAADAGVPMPVVEVVRARQAAGISRGRGEWDLASMALGAFEDAGLGGG